MSRNRWGSLLLLLTLSSPFRLHADSTAATPIAAGLTTTSLRAQLRPRTHTVLAARMSGLLSQFAVQVGDEVGQRKLLARFECQEPEAKRAMVQAKLQAARTRNEINRRLAQLDNVSELELAMGKAEESVLAAELNQIETLIARCQLYAPFAGQVVAKLVQPHQYVAEGEPLLRLVDTRDLEIEMVVPSLWLKRLTVAAPFQLRIDETNQLLNARVVRIVGEIDPVSQTVHILGELLNPPNHLLPGMSGELLLPTGATPEP